MNSTLIQISMDDVTIEKIAALVSQTLEKRFQKPFAMKDAAAALGLDRRTIRSRIESGEIKRVPGTGRRVLIPASEIERLQKGEKTAHT